MKFEVFDVRNTFSRRIDNDVTDAVAVVVVVHAQVVGLDAFVERADGDLKSTRDLTCKFTSTSMGSKTVAILNVYYLNTRLCRYLDGESI